MIDIVISLLIITFILSWLIPVVGLIIILYSRGPVFFSQSRVGRFDKSFRCLKFRTMHVNIEADFKQAKENDPRITRIGHFLRITNIDELPQFFNVLLGHMSIVGPRPHMHKDCQNFSRVVDNYSFRSLVKPGITGLAQIKGFRGPTDNDLSIIQRYKWDAFYVRNASLAVDFFVLYITFVQTALQLYKALTSFGQQSNTKLKGGSMLTEEQIAA
ncbi:MAG: sugar transferase [Chitinophagaceae bacterium]|nr:sugar transferase [Chitinophagaceae bacterium]